MSVHHLALYFKYIYTPYCYEVALVYGDAYIRIRMCTHIRICRITFCTTLLCMHLHLGNTVRLCIHVRTYVCTCVLASAVVCCCACIFLVLDLSVFSSFDLHNTALVVTSYGRVGSALPVKKM